MDSMTGPGAHETWTVEKHFSWKAAPTAPTTTQVLTNFDSPLAKRGEVLCGLKLVPLNSEVSGPAERTKEDDIIDEALCYLRTDTLHRKWALDEPSEKTLVYITRFIGECLRLLAGCPTPSEGKLAVQRLALAPVALPEERGFALDGILSAPETRSEADSVRAYLAQVQAEVSLRLLSMFYNARGTQSPLWLAVANKSRKFFTVFGSYSAPVEEEVAYKRNLTSSRSTDVEPPQALLQ